MKVNEIYQITVPKLALCVRLDCLPNVISILCNRLEEYFYIKNKKVKLKGRKKNKCPYRSRLELSLDLDWSFLVVNQ